MYKQVAANTLYQLLAKCIGVALTFVTTVLIIQRGSPSLYGDLTKALSLIAIGFTAIDFGLNAEAVRGMNGKPLEDKRLFAATIQARIILSAAAIAAVNGAIALLPGGYTPEVKSVFWIGSLAIAFQGLYTSANAWFQRHLEYWKMSAATIIGTVTGTLITYWVMTSSPTLANLLIASTIGYAVMGVVGIALTGSAINDLNFSWRTTFALLRRSLPLGGILLLSIIASKMDAVVLGIFRNSSELGQYGFAYRIFDVILVLPVFVMNAVYPLLVGKRQKEKEELISNSSRILWVVGVVALVAAWILAPLITFIRGDMDVAISSLRLLALSLPLFYLTAPLMWQLIEAHLEKYLLLVYGTAAVGNTIGNLLLVPRFGAGASAILTGLTEAIILTGLLITKKRFYGRS